MYTLKDLLEKRGRLVAESRDLLARADREHRELSADENAQFDRLHDDIAALTETIERHMRQADTETRFGDEPKTRAIGGPNDNAGDTAEQRDARDLETFAAFCRTGRLPETRALQADNDAQAGFLAAPSRVLTKLIKALDDALWVRARADVVSFEGASTLGAASLDTDPDDADWTGEITSATEDSSMAVGYREFRPYDLSKLIKVSVPMLNRSAVALEALVVERLKRKLLVPMESAYMTGTGVGQPLGVFTASDHGISTDRDVSTGNETTYPTVDGLYEAKYTLKPQYHANATWTFHRTPLKAIAKLTDGEGQYLWQPSVQAGQPDLLLGFPVYMSEYAPSTMTTGQYVGLLGDWKNYMIGDGSKLYVQRLNELFSLTNQVGFIGRYAGDGMPVLEEAFVRVKLG